MENIWNHQYINLNKRVRIDTGVYTLQLQQVNSTTEFNFAQRNTKDLTELEWCSAFKTYIAIYTVKHLHDLDAILTYSNTVHRIMAYRGSWSTYAIQYRQYREIT